MMVILRELQVSDAKISYLWRNDPEIWKYTGSRPNMYITPSIEKEWIVRVLKKEDQKRFAICVNNEQVYVGNTQFTEICNNTAQFHMFIGEKSYWGKGIASETVRQMVKYGFETLDLNEIYLFVHKDNLPAIKSYIKCGFVACNSIEPLIKMQIFNEK